MNVMYKGQEQAVIKFELLEVVVGDDDCGYVVRRIVISAMKASRQQSTLMVLLSSRACVCGSWIRIRIHCV